MSGGHFEYKQYTIDDIADSIEDYLYGHDLDDCEVQNYMNDYYSDEDMVKYVVEHHHTMPNYLGFRYQTLQQMRRAVKTLRKAAVYAQRIDWLLCGDDGEDTFIKRLFVDLKDVKQGRKVDY